MPLSRKAQLANKFEDYLEFILVKKNKDINIDMNKRFDPGTTGLSRIFGFFPDKNYLRYKKLHLDLLINEERLETIYEEDNGSANVEVDNNNTNSVSNTAKAIDLKSSSTADSSEINNSIEGNSSSSIGTATPAPVTTTTVKESLKDKSNASDSTTKEPNENKSSIFSSVIDELDID